MKIKLPIASILLIASNILFAQKTIKTTKITNIPVWTYSGIERNYTRDELLFFITESEWKAQYVSDQRYVPYVIKKASDQFLNQYSIEAKALCYKMNLENSVFEHSYEMLTNIYGTISREEFKKYCFILTLLSKIDFSGKESNQ